MKEIHIHLYGSIPLYYLKSISENDIDYENLEKTLTKVINKELDYHKAFDAFIYVNNIVNTDMKIENGTKELMKELIKDNVTYVELRTGLKKLDGTLETYLQSVIIGIHLGTENSNLKAYLILSFRRDTKKNIADETIDLAIKYKDYIIGIDISGDSLQGNGSDIFESILRAKSNGFPVTLHIGETPKETLEQQMVELLTIKPQRVGHAVHLHDDSRKYILENKICIEMCLSSALYAGMVSDMKDHPALQLLLDNYPVAICTDDPLIFNTTLSKEYEICSRITGLGIDEIKEKMNKIESYIFKKD